MCDVYVGKLFQFSTKWIKQSLRLSTKKLQTLAQVVLKSPSFRNFKATRIYNFLKAYVDERPRPDAEEVVAFALICVDRSATEEPRASLQALAPVHLAEIVLQYYDFLLDEVAGSEPTFSDFALLLRDTVPETFVEILVSLIKANIFTLSTILNLFIESLVSMNNSDMTVHHASTLQLFLEAYFTETLTEAEVELASDEIRALHTLIRSYLTSLSVPVRFGERNIDSNMFGPRPLYLVNLKRFLDSESRSSISRFLQFNIFCLAALNNVVFCI